jgi:hypothetical protein
MTDKLSEIKQGIPDGLDWDDRARRYYVDVKYLLTELERVEAERDKYKQAAEELREWLSLHSDLCEVEEDLLKETAWMEETE